MSHIVSAQNRPEQSNLQQPYLTRNSHITPNQVGVPIDRERGVPLTIKTLILSCGGKGVYPILVWPHAGIHTLPLQLSPADAQLLVWSF